MVIKNYSVSLEEEEVNQAKKNYQKYGSKLSPLLNQLLKEWNIIEKEKETGIDK